MNCPICKNKINFEDVIVEPIMSGVEGQEFLINNVVVYFKSCIEIGCQNHIHIMKDEGWDSTPEQDMTLKDFLIKGNLIEETKKTNVNQKKDFAEDMKIAVEEEIYHIEELEGKDGLIYAKEVLEKRLKNIE